jgi:hypothetical protein
MHSLVGHLPINTYPRLIGGVAFLLLALKCARNYRMSSEPLYRYYAMVLTPMGISGLVFALPFLWTHSPQTLGLYALAGYFLVNLAITLHAAVFWTVVLRQRGPLITTMLPVGLVALIAWIVYVPTMQVHFSGNLVFWDGSYLGAIGYALLCFGTLVPTGVAFVLRSFSPTHWLAKIKALSMGLPYILFLTPDAITALANNRRDSVASSVAGTITFSIFLIIIALPNVARSQTKPSRR